MTTKKILFEGQDVSLGPTMQKLQRTAEELHSKNLEGISKEISSSKELKKGLEEQIRDKERAQKLVGRNVLADIQEEYRERKRLAEALERDEEQRLRKQGVSGAAMDTAMAQYRKDVLDPKMLAADDIRSTKQENLKEQLEAQKTTNILLREILNQDTKQWEQEVREDKRNVERFVSNAKRSGFENLPPEQRAKALYQNALLEEQKGGRGGGKNSIIKDILGAGLLRDLGSVVGQMPNARDAFDLVPGLARIGGAGLGAGVGAGVGAAAGMVSLTPDPGKGALMGATLGGEIGQRGGEIAGSALARFFSERENLEKTSLGYKAVTGRDAGSSRISGVNKFGATSSDSYQLAKEMALRAGSGDVDIDAFLGTETGYGIDKGTLMGSVASSRRTGSGFGSNIRNLLGSAESSGVDRVLFNELIQNQTQLINSLGQMTEKVDPKNITALMLEMDKMGGGFSMKDPRSMGMIQNLQGGLTNPNEFGKAMNMSVLRGMKPGGSLLDLLEMEEQGLGGSQGREFLKGTVDQFSKMFGDEDMTVLALRSRFPGIPISDLRKLAKGQNILNSMDSKDMNQEADVTGQGNVSQRSQLQAVVTDAFATGPIEGMRAVEGQMVDLFKKVFEEAIKDIDLEKTVKDSANKAWNGIRSIPQ